MGAAVRHDSSRHLLTHRAPRQPAVGARPVCRLVILFWIVKIAVSIPEDVFIAADAEAARRGLSRSAFYTEALRRSVASRSALDEAIVAGYREHPQDADIDVDALPSLAEDLGAYPS